MQDVELPRCASAAAKRPLWPLSDGSERHPHQAPVAALLQYGLVKAALAQVQGHRLVHGSGSSGTTVQGTQAKREGTQAKVHAPRRTRQGARAKAHGAHADKAWSIATKHGLRGLPEVLGGGRFKPFETLRGLSVACAVLGR